MGARDYFDTREADEAGYEAEIERMEKQEMTTEHDYAGALEWFNRANWNENIKEIHAIRHALKLAKRLQEEPSDDMRAIIGHQAAQVGFLAKNIFKAVVDQLMKEVGDAVI